MQKYRLWHRVPHSWASHPHPNIVESISLVATTYHHTGIKNNTRKQRGVPPTQVGVYRKWVLFLVPANGVKSAVVGVNFSTREQG